MHPRTPYEEIAGEGRPGAPSGGEAAWRERLEIALETLSPRQAFVIRERFLREPRATFAELAAVYEVSAGRMQQIGRRALEKLRHPSRRRFLMGQGDLTAPPRKIGAILAGLDPSLPGGAGGPRG
jgi:DNA-directed RNA polymerase specialized sigma24 family protein